MIEELLQIAAVEHSGVAQAFAQQRIANAPAQRAAEPARQRHGEAHLRPIQDFGRQSRLERFFKQPFPLPGPAP